MHYTSGTTGKPKGVKRKLNDVDPDVMAELFTGFFSLFGIPHREDQVHLCTSPNYHTAVTTFAGNALNSGHRVVFMDKWDPEETLAKIERYSVTHTHMVPTQFHRMLQLPDEVKAKYDVSSMRWAIHAAAPCPDRREAEDARLVGPGDLGVLRRHRGRRYHGDPGGLAEVPGHRRAAPGPSPS